MRPKRSSTSTAAPPVELGSRVTPTWTTLREPRSMMKTRRSAETTDRRLGGSHTPHEQNCLVPPRHQPCEQHHEPALVRHELRTLGRSSSNDELLPEQHVFSDELLAGADRVPDQSYEQRGGRVAARTMASTRPMIRVVAAQTRWMRAESKACFCSIASFRSSLAPSDS
jgi:hypothetical protein